MPAAGVIAGGVGAWSSASGGKVYLNNVINTVPQIVILANPSRVRIIFHNPGDVDIFVAPTINGVGLAIVPTTALLGGCFRVFAGATIEIGGECQGAWQVFSASGSGKPVTIMDSNL